MRGPQSSREDPALSRGGCNGEAKVLLPLIEIALLQPHVEHLVRAPLLLLVLTDLPLLQFMVLPLLFLPFHVPLLLLPGFVHLFLQLLVLQLLMLGETLLQLLVILAELHLLFSRPKLLVFCLPSLVVDALNFSLNALLSEPEQKILHSVSISGRLNRLFFNLAFGAFLHLAVRVLPDGLINHVEEGLPIRCLRVNVLVCLRADAHRRHVALVVLLLVPSATQLEPHGVGAPGGELALVVKPGQV